MAERVTEGPYRGYFTIPDSIIRQELRDDVIVGERGLYNAFRGYQMSLTESDIHYHRYRPGPNRQITGYNRSMLPYLDGYYYIRDSKDDVRKLTYALENGLVPASGNTELFNIDYTNLSVPDNYCPYLLDPCPFDWCKRCMSSGSVEQQKNISGTMILFRWIIIFIFLMMVCTIFGLAIFG